MQVSRAAVGTTLAALGVLGALAWVARWALADSSAFDPDLLLWVGAGLLSVLAVAAGAAMVRPPALRVVVGTCLGLLCWSLGAVAGLDGDPVRAGIVGLVLVVVVPVAWERTRPLPTERVTEKTAASAAREAAPEAAPAGPRRRADRRSRPSR